MADSNPNGANQFNLDPRQKLCWESYIDPRSETFGNAYQSCLKAGYEESYATQITATEWFIEKVRRLNLLGKAEKVLNKTLDYSTEDLETGKVQTDLLRVQTDVAKHITNTLGKNEGYTTKTETDITSKGEKITLTPELEKKVLSLEEDLKNSL